MSNHIIFFHRLAINVSSSHSSPFALFIQIQNCLHIYDHFLKWILNHFCIYRQFIIVHYLQLIVEWQHNDRMWIGDTHPDLKRNATQIRQTKIVVEFYETVNKKQKKKSKQWRNKPRLVFKISFCWMKLRWSDLWKTYINGEWFSCLHRFKTIRNLDFSTAR